jgi:hypothetical protein
MENVAVAWKVFKWQDSVTQPHAANEQLNKLQELGAFINNFTLRRKDSICLRIIAE